MLFSHKTLTCEQMSTLIHDFNYWLKDTVVLQIEVKTRFVKEVIFLECTWSTVTGMLTF